ncbi:hypothetical protein GCM10023195_46810 [Actinoallomurus liliacearum]|uniref:Uncharacterized protein n=1 Tax=Actinoallomurus liliacearum TaxID=1080073 RepID=A0ABP8TPI2_9ACTN
MLGEVLAMAVKCEFWSLPGPRLPSVRYALGPAGGTPGRRRRCRPPHAHPPLARSFVREAAAATFSGPITVAATGVETRL